MGNSAEGLCDRRTVSVGLNSTVIAGANARRRRLTIYPASNQQVWVQPNGPAVASAGPVVVQGQTPVVFDGACCDMGCQAITTGAPVNVYVVDEFDL